MKNHYSIRISSQKGGVGKTTVAVNLAVALSTLNYSVLLVDCDFASPAVGFFLGMDDVNIGVDDVMHGKVDIKKAIIRHNVSGLDVLPGTLTPKELPPMEDEKRLMTKVMALTDYDFIIVDTPPGLAYHKLAVMFSEILVISTPTMASIANSLKLCEIYDRERVRHNMIINRMSSKRHGLSQREIDTSFDSKSIVCLPEDPKVETSEDQHTPLWLLDSRSPFCSEFRGLVRFYATKAGSRTGIEPLAESERGFRFALLQLIKRLLGFK